MTLVTCILIVVVWVGGVALWYLYCIRRPPRLYLGMCVCADASLMD